MPAPGETRPGWLASLSKPITQDLPQDLLRDSGRRVQLGALAFAGIRAAVQPPAIP
jgi:hypothetical protein